LTTFTSAAIAATGFIARCLGLAAPALADGSDFRPGLGPQ
jgi:hypothetical protein